MKARTRSPMAWLPIAALAMTAFPAARVSRLRLAPEIMTDTAAFSDVSQG